MLWIIRVCFQIKPYFLFWANPRTSKSISFTYIITYQHIIIKYHFSRNRDKHLRQIILMLFLGNDRQSTVINKKYYSYLWQNSWALKWLRLLFGPSLPAWCGKCSIYQVPAFKKTIREKSYSYTLEPPKLSLPVLLFHCLLVNSDFMISFTFFK